MSYLVINTDTSAPMRKTLDGPLTLGRSLDCEISIDDSHLSRQHCKFEPSADGGWLVIDLASTNGTMVRGERITSHRLNDGDEVLVGRARVVFHARSSPPARPERPTRNDPAAPTRPRVLSPSDTLVDSHYPQPRIEPNPEQKSAPAKLKAPLAFQRPPATPQVPGKQRPGGLLRSIWRRLTGQRD